MQHCATSTFEEHNRALEEKHDVTECMQLNTITVDPSIAVWYNCNSIFIGINTHRRDPTQRNATIPKVKNT